MSKNTITVGNVIEALNLEVLNKADFNDKIENYSVYRANIELLNYIFYEKIKSIVIWSTRETLLLEKFNKVTKIRDAIKNVLRCKPPLIVITENFKFRKILKNLCDSHDINLCLTKHSSSHFTSISNEYIFRKIGVFRPVNGTLVNIYGVGTLIRARLIPNKSEVILSLLKNNHLYVGDDAIDTSCFGNRVYGRGNELTKKFMELRGIGVVDIEKMYGVQRVMDTSTIDIVVEVFPTTDNHRVTDQTSSTSICNIIMPFYQVSCSGDKEVARIIEACVIDFKLKKMANYNSGKEFQQTLKKMIDSQEDPKE